MSLLRKALLVNATAWVGFVIGVAQSVVLARGLGPEGVGQYTILTSALMLAVQLASIGLPAAYLYYTKNHPADEGRYLMGAVWGSLVTSLLGGVILLALVLALPGYFGTVAPWVLVVMFLHLPVTIQSGVVRMGLMVKIEARRLSLMNLVTQLLPFLMLAALWGLGALSLGMAVLGFMLVGLIRLLMGAWWTADRYSWRQRVDGATMRALSWMGVRRSWVDLMTILNTQVSIIMVQALLSEHEQVGYFSRGQRIALLAVTAGQSALPMLFSRWAGAKAEELPSHVERTMRFVSTGVLALVVGQLVLGRWLVLTLYGADFAPAIWPLYLLIPGTALFLSCRVLMELLGSRGAPELPALALGLSNGLNALLCWPLIQWYGINGAAVAASVAVLLLFAGLMVLVRQRYGVRPGACLFLRREDWATIQAAIGRRGGSRV